jgi:hypothetical protein
MCSEVQMSELAHTLSLQAAATWMGCLLLRRCQSLMFFAPLSLPLHDPFTVCSG